MITISSRDLIALWHDLATGFLSGQEDWIDERIGSNYIAYHCLLAGGWDHRPFTTEGENLRTLMKIPEKPFDDFHIRVGANGDQLIESIFIGGTRIDKLRKKSGILSFHIYQSSIEFPRKFFTLLVGLDQLFQNWKVPHLTPVALHITALKFNLITMPFLLPVLGRRAFFNIELSEVLNKDLDNLKRILAPDYPYKKHQAVWKLVKERMGPEEVY